MKKYCEYCGKEFEIKHCHYTQRFCSKRCSIKARHPDSIGLFNENTDSEAMAYILGLIITDGCVVDCKGRKEIVISLKEKELIERINKLVCPERKVYKDGANSQVRWKNNNDINLLGSIGIVERKTFITKFINISENMWDFIRGIFDGDGCVYTSNTKDKRTNRNYSYKYISITTASYLFANGLNNYLIKNGIRSRILSDSRDRTTYYVKIFRQKDVAIFAKNIYSKETVWKLDRKYNKLLSFLE